MWRRPFIVAAVRCSMTSSASASASMRGSANGGDVTVVPSGEIADAGWEPRTASDITRRLAPSNVLLRDTFDVLRDAPRRVGSRCDRGSTTCVGPRPDMGELVNHGGVATGRCPEFGCGNRNALSWLCRSSARLSGIKFIVKRSTTPTTRESELFRYIEGLPVSW